MFQHVRLQVPAVLVARQRAPAVVEAPGRRPNHHVVAMQAPQAEARDHPLSHQPEWVVVEATLEFLHNHQIDLQVDFQDRKEVPVRLHNHQHVLPAEARVLAEAEAQEAEVEEAAAEEDKIYYLPDFIIL